MEYIFNYFVNKLWFALLPIEGRVHVARYIYWIILEVCLDATKIGRTSKVVAAVGLELDTTSTDR